ncbi:hypothetical protein E2C01_094795 [Portunus trituberculatus]|uniref:Uncharacterized protein n=1 Tax=Portunus trituberculatus TaxID=210409 RepID=A0A5B7K445_PORTR|nr:hypothetical protein [Portunus trituberculatus]
MGKKIIQDKKRVVFIILHVYFCNVTQCSVQLIDPDLDTNHLSDEAALQTGQDREQRRGLKGNRSTTIITTAAVVAPSRGVCVGQRQTLLRPRAAPVTT